MTETQSKPSIGKTIVIVLVVAFVTALVVTIGQRLILGTTSTTVTGGAIGAVTGVLVVAFMRNKSS